MPLAFSDVRKTFINFVTDSQVWNGLISNAFSIGVIVSVLILLILVLSYDENKSTSKNMTSFVLYSCIFTTIMFAVHDSVLIYNYKLKNENTVEKNIISGSFNSNRNDSQFFNDIVKINGAAEMQQQAIPVSQSSPLPSDVNQRF